MHACQTCRPPGTLDAPGPDAATLLRDEVDSERWRAEVWPERLRRARRERRVLVVVDESGFYLQPGLVWIYSPEGRTPVLREKVSLRQESLGKGEEM